MMNMGLSCRKGDSRQGTNLNKGQEARKSVVGFRGGDSSDTARTEPVGWGVKGYGTRVRLGSDCPSLSAPGGTWKEHCFGIKQPIICFLWQRASGIHVPLYHGRYYREAAGPRGCG